MAGAESKANIPESQKYLVDKGLDAWQTWNKITLTAEGTAIAGGLLFGVPWLVMLGAAGAAVDGVQIYAIDEVKKSRAAKAQQVYPKAA